MAEPIEMRFAADSRGPRNHVLDDVEIHSFVRSFVIVGRGPAYSKPQRWDLTLVQCASPGEEGNWLVYASVCMTVTRRVKEGLSKINSLSGYFYNHASSILGLLSV